MSELLDYILEQTKNLFQWFWEKIMGALASLIEIIPVPDFLLNLPSLVMPSGVSYFANVAEIPFGITIIVSAYTARFLLRRIPFIG